MITINFTQYADTGEYTDNFHAVMLILSVLTPLEALMHVLTWVSYSHWLSVIKSTFQMSMNAVMVQTTAMPMLSVLTLLEASSVIVYLVL